ncbi:MAG: AAA family ATPase [Acidimicrobiales bacterium]|nr:AAA family ATPase [Acidimicrobiales bacterium]
MRFELLTISGFGPYAEPQTIDFTKLARQGLFSVSGVTGAGKTSIFDALTYALYGELPGTRETAGVRSDHVGPTDPTRVELVFAAANDRWRVVRSPEYMRAKIRSTGLTKEPAKVALYRWVGESWEPHEGSTREVNPKLKELAGLDRGQFERVGLLPQGEFRKLLHAPSSKRRELFRSLFGTSAINAAVSSLKVRAAEARNLAATAQTVRTVRIEAAASLTSQLRAIAVDHSPGQLSILPTPQSPQLDNQAADPVRDLQSAADEVELAIIPLLQQAEESATSEAAAAANALQKALDQTEQIRRRASLVAAKARLEQNRPQAEAAAVQVERAQRAQPVVASHRRFTADQNRLASAQVASANAAVELADAFAAARLRSPERSTVRDLQSIVEEQIHTFETLAEHQRNKTELSKRAAAIAGQLAGLEAKAASLAEQEEEQRAQAHVLTVRHGEAREATTLLPSQRAVVADSARSVEAALNRDAAVRTETALAAELVTAEEALTDAEEERTSLAQSLLEARQIAALLSERTTAVAGAERTFRAVAEQDAVRAELDHAAAELSSATNAQAAITERFTAEVAPRLARALIPGEPCTVCGATEHPNPALPAGDGTLSVSDQMVTAAQERTSAALITVSALQERLSILSEAVGHTRLQEASTLLDDAETALVEATDAVESVATRERALEDLDAAITLLKGRITELRSLEDEQKTIRIAALSQLGSEETADVHDLQTQLREATAVVAQFEELAGATASLDASLQELAAAREEVHAQFLATTTQVAADQSVIGELANQIADCETLLAPAGDRNPVEVLANTIAAKNCLLVVEETGEVLRSAEEISARSAEVLAADLEASGFPTLDEARSAELPQDQLAVLGELVKAFTSQWAQCEADLAALAKLNLPDHEPDLQILTNQSEIAGAEATAATARRATVQQSLQEARRMIIELVNDGAELSTALAEADRRERIANLCDAKGASKIGLEGFILRSYLHQVVNQANIRLRSLSSGRYQLVLEDEAIDGRGEWGLDLTISDSHTGEKRGVKSLSGGETFYTSLALALGLSDVLSSNGATAVSSVFIDEGFGSLDQDVIDLTVDVLSQLRNDGVTVGVITHVEAVRDALPTGLTVEKLPNGASRVVQHAS